jgi:hypothetical protein
MNWAIGVVINKHPDDPIALLYHPDLCRLVGILRSWLVIFQDVRLSRILVPYVV